MIHLKETGPRQINHFKMTKAITLTQMSNLSYLLSLADVP
jgi:hypothetical protein